MARRDSRRKLLSRQSRFADESRTEEHPAGQRTTDENMSQSRSGGLWARLMSLVQDKEEKPVPADPPVPVVLPDVEELAIPVASPAETPSAWAEPETPAPSIFDFPNLQIDAPPPPLFQFDTLPPGI